MNTKNFAILISFIVYSLILDSCQSHESIDDAAFDKVKEEKMLEKDSNGNYYEIVKSSDTTPIKPKKETPDEWTLFTLIIEKKLKSNSNKIKQIKGLPDANIKAYKKVAKLEEENNALRTKMTEYHLEMKVKMEAFKSEINKDADKLSAELTDMSPVLKK